MENLKFCLSHCSLFSWPFRDFIIIVMTIFEQDPSWYQTTRLLWVEVLQQGSKSFWMVSLGPSSPTLHSVSNNDALNSRVGDLLNTPSRMARNIPVSDCYSDRCFSEMFRQYPAASVVSIHVFLWYSRTYRQCFLFNSNAQFRKAIESTFSLVSSNTIDYLDLM